MNTLLIIDGNAIMHRAFHAIPAFKTKSGKQTNIIYGFFSILFKALSDFNPSHLIICFDTPSPTFRNKLYKDYQIQRPQIDKEFINQIPDLKQAVDEAGILRFEKDGFEADDLIGSVSRAFSNEDSNKVLILSGDKDMMQLVNKQVFLVTPQTGLSAIKLYDEIEVKKRFNLNPDQIVDLKALMGDQSDNYKGAKGIGPKTAEKLLNQFGTVEALYENLEKVDNEKIKSLLEKHRDSVFISKKLAKILTDIKIDIEFEKTKFDGFKPELKDFLLSLEMKGLTTRLFDNKPKTQDTPKKPVPQMSLF